MVLAYVLLAYIVFAPLIGCILIEYFNYYSYSSGMVGYYNGSWIFYLVNSLILVFVVYLVVNIKNIKIRDKYFNIIKRKNISWKILLILLLFLLLIMFFFKGYKTILGLTAKGEFRSKEIGVFGFGFVAFSITKFFAPSLLAYLVFIHKYIRVQKIYIIFFGFVLVSLIGFSWGFKSSAIVAILPALIIIYPRISFKNIVILSIIFIIIIYFSGMHFDKEIVESYKIDLLEFILLRMTVIEGDSYWSIFDKIINREIEPLYFDYFRYLLSFFGNKILSFLDIDLTVADTKLNYSLSTYITYIVTNSLESSTSGEYNITATYLSEGLLFLGYPYALFFTIFAGIITGLNLKMLKNSINLKKPKIAAISSTSYVFLTWSWLKGGDITSILHISNFIGIILTFYLLRFVEKKITFTWR